MTLLGWKTRAGLCLMRPAEHATPCIHCLGTRLREAGFSPRGPLAVDVEEAVAALLPEVQAADAAPVAVVLRVGPDGVAKHHLLPAPSCPHCVRSHSHQRALTPELPAEVLLDPLLGIGSWVQHTEPGSGDSALCFTSAAQVHTPANRHAITARGQGVAAEQARLGMMGETVERYAAFRPEPDRIVEARASDLDAPFLAGRDLFGFSPAQRRAARYVHLDRRRRIGWVSGRSMNGDEPVWVPAAAVYLSREWRLDEPRFCASVSHGIAAHRTLEAATAHAAFELYERRCMTRAWHCQAFGVRLAPSEFPRTSGTTLERIREAGLALDVSNIAPPGLPPVILAMLSADRAPWYMIGVGAKPTVSEAAEAALLEACSGWQALSIKPEPLLARPRLRPLEDARGHHRFHAGPERSRRIVDAVRNGTLDIPAKGSGASLADLTEETALARCLEQLGPDAVVVTMTPVDCRACGFHVVRVLAPGVPIYSFGRIGTPTAFARRHRLPTAPLPHPFR